MMKRSILAAAIVVFASATSAMATDSYNTYWIGSGKGGEVETKKGTYVGIYNSAYVLQQGEKNYTVNDQRGAFNKSQDIQYGNYNINGTLQAGINNAELTYQYGTANLAMTNQNGFNNIAQHVQIGLYNRSLIDQRGSGNVAANFQSGWNGKIRYHGAVPVYGPKLDVRPHHYYGAFKDIAYTNPPSLPGGKVGQAR